MNGAKNAGSSHSASTRASSAGSRSSPPLSADSNNDVDHVQSENVGLDPLWPEWLRPTFRLRTSRSGTTRRPVLQVEVARRPNFVCGASAAKRQGVGECLRELRRTPGEGL